MLNDPGRGMVSVSMEEFDRSFTGICLMIEPGEQFAPGGKPKSVVEFARHRLEGTGPAAFCREDTGNRCGCIQKNPAAPEGKACACIWTETAGTEVPFSFLPRCLPLLLVPEFPVL